MSRMIDADAFDERVRVAGGMAEEELTDDFKDGVLTTLEMLKTQPTVPQWIPCSEKLPYQYQDVLVSGKGIVKSAQYIGSMFECDDLETYGVTDGTKVIGAETFNALAWMPLPEPYRTEE